MSRSPSQVNISLATVYTRATFLCIIFLVIFAYLSPVSLPDPTQALPVTNVFAASPNYDLNGDGVVDLTDLQVLLNQWLGTGTGDLNSDGTVNGHDFAAWVDGFTSEPPPEISLESCETRAVWLNAAAFSDDGRIQSIIQKIQDANLNTIFALAPPVGGNKGWSNPTAFDNLITAAKSHGISIHGWIANLYRLDKNCSEGDPDPFCTWRADFTSSGEQDSQAEWARALLTEYPDLDGIHLDYIRYETEDQLDSEKINGVTATVRKTYNLIKSQFPGKYVTAAVRPPGQWCVDHNNPYPSGDDIPEWFTRWFDNYPGNRWDNVCWDRDANGNCTYCDCVPSGLSVQQDAQAWLNEGIIDGVQIMDYPHQDKEQCYNCWWKESLHYLADFQNGTPNKIDEGLGWEFNTDWSIPFTKEEIADGIVNKVEYGRTVGLKGFSIFELGKPGIDDYILINKLSAPDGPFAQEAISCISPSWTPPVSPDPTIVEIRVTNGNDDGEECLVNNPSNSVSLNSSDLELVYDSNSGGGSACTGNQTVGIRFRNINIPQGASITKAYIQFTVDEVGGNKTYVTIHGESTDSATELTTQNISSRTTTTAYTEWQALPWGTVGRSQYAQRTPNLASIVEEITDRTGWQASNSIVFIITGFGTRTAEAFEGGASLAPLLHVEYIMN